MPDWTAVDPDVLDEDAAYGPEPTVATEPRPSESPEDRAARLQRAFEGGATLRLEPPPVEEAEPVDPEAPLGRLPDGTPRRRRRRGSTTETPRPRRTRNGAQLGSLFVAGFTIMVGFAIGDWAAPTKDEGDAMAVPLGNILARRIDLTSKLGEDTDDVVNLAIAIMAWMSRVGPMGVSRARETWNDRQQRRAATRVDRPPTPLDAANGGRAGDVVDGGIRGAGTPDVPTHHPLDAVAASARNGLGYLDRSLGGTPRPPHPLARGPVG